MPRPRPIGRKAREITLANCSIIDKLALMLGRPHHRGWEVHSAFKSQAELDAFRREHAAEVEEMRKV